MADLHIPDLAKDEADYVWIAIALAQNPQLRQQQRQQIEQKMQQIPRFMDSRSYSAQIGSLFE